jgi:hypothetical protein
MDEGTNAIQQIMLVCVSLFTLTIRMTIWASNYISDKYGTIYGSDGLFFFFDGSRFIHFLFFFIYAFSPVMNIIS